MFSVNQKAVRIVKEKIIPNAEMLQCEVHQLKNGATVIDMGIHARGGYLAGKLFVEATIGDMGHVDFGRFTLGEIDLPSIDVYIDLPQTATLSSQFSGWELGEGFEKGSIIPIGSGPARAIAKIDLARRGGAIKTFITKLCLPLKQPFCRMRPWLRMLPGSVA